MVSRVRNGYVSSGTGGHARPLEVSVKALICSENVPASALVWTRVPHSSFSRNEGVPGSSLGVGFKNTCKAVSFVAWEGDVRLLAGT